MAVPANDERVAVAFEAAGLGSFVWYPEEDRGEPDERMLALFGLPADGTLGTTHCTDDGVGLVYDGTDLVEAVSDRPDAAAYIVERQPDGTVIETRIEPRLLG